MSVVILLICFLTVDLAEMRFGSFSSSGKWVDDADMMIRRVRNREGMEQGMRHHCNDCRKVGASIAPHRQSIPARSVWHRKFLCTVCGVS